MLQFASVQEPTRNSMLGMLSEPSVAALVAHLEPVTLKLNDVLHSPDQKIEYVYFLDSGICSIVVNLKDGSTIEVGIIGRESFVGAAVLLGTDRSRNGAFMQIAGSGQRLKVQTLQQLLSRDGGELRTCLMRGVQGLLTQAAQTAACNRMHGIEERLVRWLLLCQDRLESDDLPLTHEFLAMMLGTRRSTVTIAAGVLEKAGLIEHRRGTVKILNRERMEHAACECFSVIEDEYRALGLL